MSEQCVNCTSAL